jgi:angio-associated migratory cell protein
VHVWLGAGGFTADGKAVVTAGGEGDGSVRVWNPKTGTCDHVISSGHGTHDQRGITCMAFAEDPAVAASGGEDGAVVIHNVVNGRAVAKLEQHEGSIEGVAFVPKHNMLVSAGMDGQLIIWDAGALAPRGVCKLQTGISCIALSGGAPLVASGSVDGVTRVIDVRTGTVISELGGGDAVQCICWADRKLVTGSDDGIVRCFELQ